MNYKLMLHTLGRTLQVEALCLLVPLVVSLYYREDPLPFLYTILPVAILGTLLSRLRSRAEFFSQEEMNHLTGVCQQPESLRNGQQALADYIRIVQTEAEKRLGGGTADPLLAATEKYKDKKGTGGKQHGK